MSHWSTIAVWIVSAGPAAAWLFALMDRTDERQMSRRVANGAALAVLLSALALLIEFVRSEHIAEVTMLRWLDLPGIAVTFGARCDGLALVFVILSSLVLWLVLGTWPAHRGIGWLMLSWLGVTDLVTSNNLGQMVWGWFLSGWAASELIQGVRNDRTSSPRPIWLMQRVSDIALLVSVVFVWINWKGSLSLASITVASASGLPNGVPDGIGLYVLLAAMGRCALMPLGVWLETDAGFAARENRSVVGLSNEMVGLWNVPNGHHVAERLQTDPANHWHHPATESASPEVLAWWLCGVFLPTGIFWLLRMEPILSLATNTRLLALVVGSFTLLMSAASAVAQNSWPRVLSQLVVAHCGLVLVAMSLDHPHGLTGGLFLLVVQSLFLAVLIVTGSRTARPSGSRITWLAGLLLASGLWGRHRVADLVWELAAAVRNARLPEEQQDNVALGGTIAQLLPLAVWLISISELLLNVALFRAIFLQRRLADEAHDRGAGTASFSAIVLLVFAASSALWPVSIGVNEPQGIVSRITEIPTDSLPLSAFGVGSLLPLSVAGIGLAWLLYSRTSSVPERLAQLFGPFSRLSRNRFYWDDLCFLLFTKPVLSVSTFLAWFDRAGAKADQKLLDQSLQAVSDSAEPLTDGRPSVYALTAFGAVVVLAWMLLWLR